MVLIMRNFPAKKDLFIFTNDECAICDANALSDWSKPNTIQLFK